MNEIEELRLAVSALSTQLADAKETYEHIAEAAGCAERVWGQSGVMVASEEGLLRDIKEMRQAWEQLAEAKADAEDWKQVSRDWRMRAESAEAEVHEQRDDLAEVEKALVEGRLRKREDYFPEVAQLRRRNREMHDRAQKAEVALAEERAKRAALEDRNHLLEGYRVSNLGEIITDLHAHKDRAEKLERPRRRARTERSGPPAPLRRADGDRAGNGRVREAGDAGARRQGAGRDGGGVSEVTNLFGGGFSDTDPAMLTVGDVKQLSAMIEALVDYLESREWSGPHVSVTRLFRGNYVEGRERSCEGCNGTQASGHKDDCRWLAMMRAAGRR